MEEKTGKVRSFRDLRVWQRAMELVPRVYELLKKLPREERFALVDQIRRAAVSIPSNIAQGHARRHTKEFLQHLSIARGSLAELLTLLLVAERLGYLPKREVEQIEQQISDVRMPLSGLINRL
ncbi:MAG: four helix bundle protein, partial [Thermoanaerobaculaceae bacterium]|nr:four helix bundle protein [Thermoanaerobaculaceae bacterium]